MNSSAVLPLITTRDRLIHFNLDSTAYYCWTTPVRGNLADWQDFPWLSCLDWFEQLARFMQTNVSTDLYQLILIGCGPQTVLALPIRIDAKNQQIYGLTNYYSPLLQPLTTLAATTAWPLIFTAIKLIYPTWRQLTLAPCEQHLPQQLTRLRLPKIALLTTQVDCNWQAKANSSQQYWQQRASTLKNTVARKTKKLQALGARTEIMRTIDAQAIADYWHVYQHSWKPQEPTTCFINWLMQASSEQRQLRLGILYLEQQPIACQLWLVCQNKAAIFKLAQNCQFDAMSPGTVLMAEMFNYVLTEDKVCHIDFLTGDDSYKANWMDTAAPLYQIKLFNIYPLVNRLTFYALIIKQQLKKLAQHLSGWGSK